ncbi:putative HNS binding protein [Escherichia phage vB_EcoP-Ro103C3lw]|nr:putative HNS binding protein [Escherichia phage vB_EcoP-Ro103C3lw]
MAITKRLSCKFDLKIVFTSDDVEAYARELVQMSKDYVSGEKQDGLTRKLVETAVEHGVEAAIELHLKSVLGSKLKDELPEDGATLSNISVGFKR